MLPKQHTKVLPSAEKSFNCILSDYVKSCSIKEAQAPKDAWKTVRHKIINL